MLRHDAIQVPGFGCEYRPVVAEAVTVSLSLRQDVSPWQ